MEKLQIGSDDMPTAEDLLAGCKSLLAELDEYRSFLLEGKGQHTVELRQFRNSLVAELKSLEKLSKEDQSSERTRHTLRSSNLPFYTAVWDTAKSSRGIVAFNKRFHWTDTGSPPDSRLTLGERRKLRSKKKPKGSAMVDIVADNGGEWIKVSTVTEKKIVFEMAKRGWEGESSEEDQDDEVDGDGWGHHNGREEGEEDDGLSLVRLAEDLSHAASKERVRYRHPQIRLVLPKIESGRISQIDDLIQNIQAMGVTVQCSSDISTPEPLDVAKSWMLVDEYAHFSSVLNIDCTILLALVSDLSHDSISLQRWFHVAIQRQIERESGERLLPTCLWPAMGARKLVCTSEAARRMREISETIGTEAERRRTALLMGDERGKGPEELVNEFNQLSKHEVPHDWKLPIEVVAADDVKLESLPKMASVVADGLYGINRSVFLYGWASGRTTISSNRTVARMIEKVIEDNRSTEDEVGPDVWLCPMARSLVGKEKGRRKTGGD